MSSRVLSIDLCIQCSTPFERRSTNRNQRFCSIVCANRGQVRRTKPVHLQRSSRIIVQLTGAEVDRVALAAALDGKSMSRFVRDITLSYAAKIVA